MATIDFTVAHAVASVFFESKVGRSLGCAAPGQVPGLAEVKATVSSTGSPVTSVLVSASGSGYATAATSIFGISTGRTVIITMGYETAKNGLQMA